MSGIQKEAKSKNKYLGRALMVDHEEGPKYLSGIQKEAKSKNKYLGRALMVVTRIMRRGPNICQGSRRLQKMEANIWKEP